MNKYLLVIFLVMSCPRPSIKKIPESDYINEAMRIYIDEPITAYNIIMNNVISPQYANEKLMALIKIFCEQREYEKAATLLDSIDWSTALSQDEINNIALKTSRWQRLIALTSDDLMKGIAYYNLTDYQSAIEFLSKPEQPHDYRLLYLARAYMHLNDFGSAVKAIFLIDSISPYLFNEYQDILFNILFNLDDINIVQQELVNLKDPSLRSYVLLRIYETKNDKKNLKVTAWQLIKRYPKSPGALYALKKVTPKTKSDYEAFGRVCYHHAAYDRALKYLSKAARNDTVNYFLGKIYYNKGNYKRALKYFEANKWSEAYYYRGRIYEDFNEFDRAIMMYDSLYGVFKKSKYAIQGLKRKAFLLEDLGDTLNAIETFLGINEKNTKFRAAMQLYRVGDLNRAAEILDDYEEPDFLYWQIRVKERLAEPVESLKTHLQNRYSLSYYSLVRSDCKLILDTMSLDNWVKQFGDTLTSLSDDDSLHLMNALRYFNLNEYKNGIEELGMIEVKNPQDILYLSRICTRYGADKQAIRYSLRLKDQAEKCDINTIPLDLLKLLYPIRYAFSISENHSDLSLSLAMIWQESLFDPNALSVADARGLMQIIPNTAKLIAREMNIQTYSLNDPSLSIKFGLYYFKKLLEDFNSIPLSLAGYNAGPLRVKKWISKDSNSEIDEFIELIPFNETRDYVKSVLGRQVVYEKLIGEKPLN